MTSQRALAPLLLVLAEAVLPLTSALVLCPGLSSLGELLSSWPIFSWGPGLLPWGSWLSSFSLRALGAQSPTLRKARDTKVLDRSSESCEQKGKGGSGDEVYPGGGGGGRGQRPRGEGRGLLPLLHHSLPELGAQGWMGGSHPPLASSRPGGKVDRDRVGTAWSCLPAQPPPACSASAFLALGAVSIFLQTLTWGSSLSCSKRFCRFRSF